MRSMGVCVPNFRSVSFFVWPGGVTQLHTHMYIQVNLGISYDRLLASRGFWHLVNLEFSNILFCVEYAQSAFVFFLYIIYIGNSWLGIFGSGFLSEASHKPAHLVIDLNPPRWSMEVDGSSRPWLNITQQAYSRRCEKIVTHRGRATQMGRVTVWRLA